LPHADPGGDGLYLGLISGTSADGIDVALLRLSARTELLAAETVPYPVALRDEVLALSQQPAGFSLDRFGELDALIGEAFAQAALGLLAKVGFPASDVVAIGSHGQTLRHRPDRPQPFTLQVGDPHRIAERTGITTVADFRRRDVAAGGQGAPLVPAFHAALFAAASEDRAVLNLGGIANLTLLPKAGAVRGFDTGPGNGLMDAWSLRHRGTAFDAEGRFAAEGTPCQALIEQCLAAPYFALPPPKSSGRDHFHLGWLDAQLQSLGRGLAPADVQASLVELTARSVANDLRRWQPGTQRVLACGGGVHNPALMQALAHATAPAMLTSTAEFGLDPDFVEAAAFAWLARETLANRPGNLPDVTGAAGLRVLGAIIPA
jgi:anhydro-N-acetylmuramic acid kinase